MTCSICNHNYIEKVISATSSCYFYCPECKTEREKAFKNLAFDSIYKEFFNFLKNSKKDNIKIEVNKVNKKLQLIINSIEIYCVDFCYNFSNMDIYYIENTLHDLIDDILHLDACSIDVLVKL